MLRLLGLCFVLSGAAALVFQLAQARLLATALGAGAWSHVVVLTAFFGGSALGAAVLGRVVDRIPRHAIALYVGVELAIAGLAAFGVEFTHAAGTLWRVMSSGAAPDAALIAPRFGVACLALLPATFAMGGTLPILGRWVRDHGRELGADLSRFYALNALGAGAGVLLAGFVLLPRLGVETSLRCAAIGNIAAALLALVAGARGRATRGEALAHADEFDQERDPDAASTARAPAPLRPCGEEIARRRLLLAALAGGAASLTMEIVWTRLFAIVFGSSTHAFTLMLAAFVLGIGGGSLGTASLLRRGWAPARIVRGAWSSAALLLVLQLPFYPLLPWLQFALEHSLEREPSVYAALLTLQALLAMAWMLPVTLAAGAALPALITATAGDSERTGRDVGLVLAANTVGTVSAPVLATFVLLPALGLQRSVLVAAAVLAAASVPFASRARPAAWRAWPVAIVLLGALVPSWNASVLHAGGFRRWTVEAGTSFGTFVGQRRQLDVVYEHDGPVDSVVVLRNEAGEHYLKVNGKTDASDTPDLATQRLVAHIPLLLHGASVPAGERDVFVVGVGSGVTVGSAALHEGVRVTAAELSEGVLGGSHFFTHVNHDYSALPNVRAVHADAREWLARDPRRWDVIINQPSNPWVAGNAALFSREFFELARDHLAPGGLMTQWMHIYAMDDATLSLVIETFASVYPHVEVWWPQAVDMVLIGSLEPLHPDPSRLATLLSAPAVAADLNAFASEGLRVDSLHRFAALQVLSAPRFARHFAGAPPWHTDAFPRLEYAAPRARFVGRQATLLHDLDERTAVRHRADLLAARLPLQPADRVDLLEFFAARETPFAQQIAGSLQHAVFADDPTLDAMPGLATRATGMVELFESWTALLLAAGSPTAAQCDAWSRAALQALPRRASIWFRPPAEEALEAFALCAASDPQRALTWDALAAELLVRTGYHAEGTARIDALLLRPLPDEAVRLLEALRPVPATAP